MGQYQRLTKKSKAAKKSRKAPPGPCRCKGNNEAYLAAEAKGACEDGLKWLEKADLRWSNMPMIYASWAARHIPSVLRRELETSIYLSPFLPLEESNEPSTTSVETE